MAVGLLSSPGWSRINRAVETSPEGKEAAGGKRTADNSRRAVRSRLSGFLMPSRWEQEFDAENSRRRRQQIEEERILASRDEEPNTKHELVWITRDIGVCPICRSVYTARGKGTARVIIDYPSKGIADDLAKAGVFRTAADVLAQRQATQQEKDTARREKQRDRGRRGKRASWA